MTAALKIEIISLQDNLPQAPQIVKAGMKAALEDAGKRMAEAIKQKIQSNVPPPLAEETVRRKGSDRTLIDTGAMLSQVSSKVISDTEVQVGVFGDRADVAMYQEFGTSTIPERSFIRSSFEGTQAELSNMIAEKLNAELMRLAIK